MLYYTLISFGTNPPLVHCIKLIFQAIKNGSEQEMKTLLSAIDNADEINDHDDLGFNALHYAVKFNRLLIMNTLSSKGAGGFLQTLVALLLQTFFFSMDRFGLSDTLSPLFSSIALGSTAQCS